MWGAGVALEFVAPPIAGKGGADAPLHLEHLPERFALFVILVLGESVAAVVTGVQDAEWDRRSVAVAVPAFVIAVALWWTYFDLSGAAAKRRLQDEGGNSRVGVHDRYLFAHLPLAGGLVAVSVGLEHSITEARDAASTTGTGWTLAGGLALYLTATWTLQALTDRLRSGLLWPGLAIPAVLVIGALASGFTMLVLLAVILVAGVVVGLARRETGDLPTADV
jgi:low temperature requirement protein LtrA